MKQMEQNETRPQDDAGQIGRARERIHEHEAARSVERLRRAVCDPSRMRIVQALSVGSLSVNDLAAVIERTPTATSQHLRVLRELGLVEGQRRGTVVRYRMRSGPTAEHVLAVLHDLEQAALSHQAA
jgi:ArsR family transcriptional regulator, lead/cadmium/zinc/bismuth-responsive transcriptional repressor